MNVAIVKIGHSMNLEKLAQNMAQIARTNPLSPEEFDHDEVIDLLVVGFDGSPLGHKQKKLTEFISSLDRQHIKNIALFSSFIVSNRFMKTAIKLCEEANLPLMREQFCCRFPLKCGIATLEDAMDGAKGYIEDMITIVRNYY